MPTNKQTLNADRAAFGIEAIKDHIRASAPCTLSGVIAWAKWQGLAAYAPRAINEILASGEAARDEKEIWLN